MLGIFIILLLCLYMIFLFPIFKKKSTKKELSDKTAVQVKKLWQIAQSSMRDRRTAMRAEKALLAILRVDEKNAAAYNRLGILYAKSQKFDEAIECFEIAQSLDNNASSLHNVGLIYLETGEYEKAAMAFRQAIELEGDMPARFIALSKAEEKLGNRKNAIEALESAYALDNSITTLRQILAIHKAAEDEEAIAATQARIESHLVQSAAKKQRESRRISRIAHGFNATRPAARNSSTSATRQPRLRRPVARPSVVSRHSATTSPRRPVARPSASPRRKIQ